MDHLVYSEERKSLVLAFVEHHERAMRVSDDVITGKGIVKVFKLRSLVLEAIAYLPSQSGQGLVVLLSGPPGTGKTLAAEAGQSLSENAWWCQLNAS